MTRAPNLRTTQRKFHKSSKKKKGGPKPGNLSWKPKALGEGRRVTKRPGRGTAKSRGRHKGKEREKMEPGEKKRKGVEKIGN